LTAGRKPFQPVPRRPFRGRVSKDTRQRVRMPRWPEKAAGYPDSNCPSLHIIHETLKPRPSPTRIVPSTAVTQLSNKLMRDNHPILTNMGSWVEIEEIL
jgi:hypothetical protein